MDKIGGKWQQVNGEVGLKEGVFWRFRDGGSSRYALER